MTSLPTLFGEYGPLTAETTAFLQQLEKSIAQDLWGSVGGIWSEASINVFRQTAMQKLAEQLQKNPQMKVSEAWTEVVRDFHQHSAWGETRLLKKEKKPETEEDRIFWELFSYIWILLQATFIVKTVIFYFGIKSAAEDSSEGRVYVVLAMLFSVVSLGWFAYRKSRRKTK
ncbi:hypothetical protein QJS83_04925 [Bdellovibrio sp. 22V]|uniref:hypothetical protein n=1 Tax=Bdellovibrio sp. 22V TaxID=3044166 RepID=UPI0025430164|nr:hypothetical protein [Bdellovibrio sp. 22V]WII73214.1 hypothetical protein QJS83_04925 [Bdellovibrio sp. 22V]